MIWAGVVFRIVVLCHQGMAMMLLLAQAGMPGQYPGAACPVQARVTPLSTLMTSTLPDSGPSANSSSRDTASILPSGDSAAPVTSSSLLWKVTWPSLPGWPSGETVRWNKVMSATPGGPPAWDMTITKCRPSPLPKASPRTQVRPALAGGTGIAAVPVTCPSAEARTTTCSPSTTR